MHFIEISNIFKSEKKRYKVTAVLKLLVVFALLGFFLSNKPMYHVQTDFYLKRMGFVFFGMFLDGICNSLRHSFESEG